MAAGLTPHLHEPQVCETDCVHRDCASNRALVRGHCHICRKEIGEGARFYYCSAEVADLLRVPYAPDAEGQAAVHADCLEDAADAQIAARRALEDAR